MARKAAPVAPKLSFEGDLDIFSIHQQWEKALPLLTAASGSAEVDLSSVGDLDLSGLQLLGALDRDLRAKGLPLVVVGAKAEWKTRFATLGLAHLLDGARP
ncbi:MAG: STAS domain-containing protein [Holophagaceae bacterium]|nr:STAS domain-containing protein [Holophagaceae bacterium]